MAKRNKTEFDALTNSTIVPTVTNAIHITHLEALTESAVLKKHRVGSITVTGATQNVDFTNYETYTINRASTDCDYTISGLAIGQIGHIQFSSAGTISFTNVTLMGANVDNGSFRMQSVTYTIINVNGSLYGWYTGNQSYSTSAALDFEDLNGYTTDFLVPNLNSVSNAPWGASSDSLIHIRTRKLANNLSSFEVFRWINGSGDFYYYVGRTAGGSSIDWQTITSIT